MSSIENWTSENVLEWAISNSLPQDFCNVLQSECIDGLLLMEINDGVLKSFCPGLGLRDGLIVLRQLNILKSRLVFFYHDSKF